MDSKKPDHPSQFLPPDLARSVSVAFFLVNLNVFQEQNSSASVTAGVFCGYNRSIVA